MELRKKSALVLVEQNLPLVCAIADRVYALSEGRIMAELADRESIKPEVCEQYLYGMQKIGIRRFKSGRFVGLMEQ